MQTFIKIVKKNWYLLLVALILISAIVLLVVSNRDKEQEVNLEQTNPVDQNAVFEEEIQVQEEIIADRIIDTSEEVSEVAVVFYLETELKQNNTRHNCWIVFANEINGDNIIEIYDISNWIYPGASDITPACGQNSDLAKTIFTQDKQDKPPKEYYKGPLDPF